MTIYRSHQSFPLKYLFTRSDILSIQSVLLKIQLIMKIMLVTILIQHAKMYLSLLISYVVAIFFGIKSI